MNVMEIVKQRRFEVVCLLATVLLLLALVPVSKEGHEAESKANSVGSMIRQASTLLTSGGPVGLANPAKIQAHNQNAEKIAAEVGKLVEQFESLNARVPLLDRMFPEPAIGNAWSYKKVYDDAIENLLQEDLNAGWPGESESGPSHTSDGQNGSQNIGLYVRREDISIGEWVSLSDQPSGQDCWFGQLSYWIQKDLAEVIRDLNEDAADQQNQTPSVKNAVVKRIISIDVEPFYYVGQEKQQRVPFGMPPATDLPGGVGFPGAMGALNPYMMDMGEQPQMYGSGIGGYELLAERARKYKDDPFTKRFSDDKVDVLQFTFSLVIDSRKVNEFLEALAHKNLYTILSVSISRQDVVVDPRKFTMSSRITQFNPRQQAGEELLYGPDPVVRLDIAAEALFLRSLYGEMIPQMVREALSESIKAKEVRNKALADAQKAAASKAKKAKRGRKGR